MSDEVLYVKGPRYLDGVNLDAGIISAEPKTTRRQISDPVNDGSLGKPTYVPGSENLDGTPL
jgi:hypothetical protein